jgi:aldehyde:ferredoxin oxidoreductase
MKIVRVNMDTLQASFEEAPKEYELIGNRGLIAKILLKEVPPACHPLSARNKLIFATGPLAGTGVPTAGRLSAGGKSPLTGGIKESNSGGVVADALVEHEIKAIIIENKPKGAGLYALVIAPGKAELVPCDDLKGLGNYDTHRKLLERYGSKATVASIGPAGEMRALAAGIFTSDMEGLPGAVCARGGLGALMGAKGLKALVVLDGGEYTIPVKQPDRLKEALKKYHEVIRSTPQTAQVYPKYGTSPTIMTFNALGGLPTYNFRRGDFEFAEKIGAEALYTTITERGGEGNPTHRCMNGCPIRCYNKYPDSEGKLMVSPIQFETLAMLGSNLGIGDLDAICRLNCLCNDQGVDTVEIGVALGMAMEAGLLQFGDGAAAAGVVEGIGKGEALSRVLASGAVVTGKVFGIERVPAVRGQALPAHEPRAVKGIGVTFSTSAMGADHTTGVTFREKVDHQKPEGQVEASVRAQIKHAAFDTLGLCFFVGTAVQDPMLTVDLVNAVYGTDFGEEFWVQIAKDTLRAERAFNEAAGFTRVHDRLPEFFREEKLPPRNLVFDVPQEEIDRVWSELLK